MFYSTNQSYHWKSDQSEVAISGRLANQKSGKKTIRKEDTKRNNQVTFSFFFHFSSFYFHFFHNTCLASNNTKICRIVVATTGFSFPAILFSLFASNNLIFFNELALLLVIFPFPAILFSLSASYNIFIFYELALSLVICPFPAILFS